MMLRHTAIAAIFLGFAATACADPDEKLKEQIAKAIKGGQDYIKASRKANGGGAGAIIGPGGINPGAAMGFMGGVNTGTSTLSGLALVESGLDDKDPVVAAIARLSRESALSTTSTYEISLLIMLLDRLASPQDEGLIQFLTLRLMGGQMADGSWTYTCDGIRLDPVEQRLLWAELTKTAKLTTPTTPHPKNSKPREDLDPETPKTPKKDKPEEKKEEPEEPAKSKMHPALEKLARSVRPGGGMNVFNFTGDHSNTQFATVGLWCGRRHGVNVTDSLALLEKHYRGLQVADGGWAYTGSGGGSSPSMTCAGLMGLAMGFGAKKVDPEEIGKDRNVEAGLKYVGTFLSAAADQREAPGGAGGFGGFRPNELSANLYFMWSLERVGMVYGLKTIGKVDWYDWGSRVLVSSQQGDGSWTNGPAQLHGNAENATAFALLFLSRSNLAKEVSTKLTGKMKDPGASRLVTGGDLDKLIGDTGKSTSGSKTAVPGNPTQPKDPTIGTATDKAGKLAQELLAAGAGEREALLTKYRDTSGVEFTDALARAAAKSTGELQISIRDALTQRLTRMKAVTLNECMRHSDRELRRAAALASGAKGQDRLPDLADSLVRLIADDEAVVAQAARATLKTYSGKDFGPEVGASAADRGKALLDWRNWWASQKR
jgi:hypothetical protein